MPLPTQINQTPAIVHVKIVQGDSWYLIFDFSIDLTGQTIVAAIHPRDGSAAIGLAKTDIDLSNGQFRIDLTKTQSAALAIDRHTWNVIMTSGETERTYISGTFICSDC